MNIVRAIYENPLGKILVLACCVPFAASATLIGDPVNIAGLGGAVADQVAVGAGPELTGDLFMGGDFEYDVGASSVSITNVGEPIRSTNGAILAFFDLFDLDWVPPDGPGIVTGVTLASSIGYIGSITPGFGDDFVFADFGIDLWPSSIGAGLPTGTGVVTFDIIAEHDNGNDIPEPTTLALLGLGLVGLGATRGRRRR